MRLRILKIITNITEALKNEFTAQMTSINLVFFELFRINLQEFILWPKYFRDGQTQEETD
jgi:hypothetical protein